MPLFGTESFSSLLKRKPKSTVRESKQRGSVASATTGLANSNSENSSPVSSPNSVANQKTMVLSPKNQKRERRGSILGDGDLHQINSRFCVPESSNQSDPGFQKRGRDYGRRFESAHPGRASNTLSSCGRSSKVSTFSQCTSSVSIAPVVKIVNDDKVEIVSNIAMPGSRQVSSIADDEHELATKWSLWEMVHDGNFESSADVAYENACRHIKTFATIEQFMALFNGMPRPSCVLDKKHMVRKLTQSDLNQLSRKNKTGDGNTESISALMIFREGVSPTWEDPSNAGGGHFQFVFNTDFPVFAVDELWERALFSILGNAVEGAEHITGIRLADKLSNGYQTSSVANVPTTAVRLEVWHSELPADKIAILRRSLHNIFSDPLTEGGSVTLSRPIKRKDRSRTAFSYELFNVQVDIGNEIEMATMDGRSVNHDIIDDGNDAELESLAASVRGITSDRDEDHIIHIVRAELESLASSHHEDDDDPADINFNFLKDLKISSSSCEVASPVSTTASTPFASRKAASYRVKRGARQSV